MVLIRSLYWCQKKGNQRPNARHRHHRLDGPLERRLPPPVGSRARTLEAHRRGERPEGPCCRRECMDGRHVSGDDRKPRLAKRREQRPHGVQLLGGEGARTAMHPPYIAKSVRGRARGQRHASACGKEPVLSQGRYFSHSHGL